MKRNEQSNVREAQIYLCSQNKVSFVKQIKAYLVMIIMLFFAPISVSFAQSDCDILFDFESGTYSGNNVTVTSDVVNPYTSGINQSSKCLQVALTASYNKNVVSLPVTVPYGLTFGTSFQSISFQLAWTGSLYGKNTYIGYSDNGTDWTVSEINISTNFSNSWSERIINVSTLNSDLQNKTGSFYLGVGIKDGAGTNYYMDNVKLIAIPENCISKITAKLNTLSVSHSDSTISLSPLFDSDSFSYSAIVENAVDTVTIVATAASGYTVTGDIGIQSLNESLDQDANVFTITVTKDEDSKDKRDYTVKITRIPETGTRDGCNILFDFESERTYSGKNVTVDTVVNPYTSGINSSSKCLEITSTTSYDKNVVSLFVVVPEGLTFGTSFQSVSFQLASTSTQNGKGTYIGYSDNGTDWTVYDFNSIASNFGSAWIERVVDVSTLNSNLQNKTGFFYLGIGIRSSSGTNYYMDNVKLTAVPENCTFIPEIPAKLSTLSVSCLNGEVPLTPSFNADSLYYSASVENTVESITIAAAAESGYTVTGDTGTRSLNEGANIFKINVTKDGNETNKCEYTVTITREEPVIPEILAKLTTLSVSCLNGEVPLTPSFNADSLYYSASVENAVESITITAAAESGYTVTGDTGTRSLNEGANIFKIKVAKDGNETNKCEYTVTITREEPVIPEIPAKLSTLSISYSGGEVPLTPSFNADSLYYSASVENAVESITIAAAAESGYTVTGDTGTRSLNEGANIFKINVTKDGNETNKCEYTVTITREEPVIPEIPAKLTTLSVSCLNGEVPLTPSFNADSLYYSASVENAVESITITAAAESGYTVTGDTGTRSLNEGTNIFKINVTKDGNETNKCEYTVTITKAGISTQISTVKTSGQNVNVFANNNEIHIVSDSKILRTYIYNIFGALLYKAENINADNFNLISSNFPEILIIKILTEKRFYNIKIINK